MNSCRTDLPQKLLQAVYGRMSKGATTARFCSISSLRVKVLSSCTSESTTNR